DYYCMLYIGSGIDMF
nr:immunoglobulin light chain junction region [Macaca mulatta]MOX72836.1 immunoglobulin light chain junction region [Macaca mulatta]MOX76327.1 immunoglobulin light chain junction region [Macaca mulatta]MOX76434.1 immunoglobulin light chain junction region [Macaca mulatta]MOX77001.1 immunoglobulin light chain junction region [Macaca mulatta]